jgi:AraC family transcriptional regulator
MKSILVPGLDGVGVLFHPSISAPRSSSEPGTQAVKAVLQFLAQFRSSAPDRIALEFASQPLETSRMSIVKKASWVIERNHARELSLDEIASSCGVSKFHLAHAFGRSTGLSAMQYLRGRRLTEAAQLLAKGAPDILQLALQSGYASHEAFSRAFRAQFAVTPESVRSRGALDGLALVQPIKADYLEDVKVNPPKIVSEKEILAVGLSESHSFGDVDGIPGQWQRFMAVAHEILHKIPGIPIGVSSNVDAEGRFDYLCAVEVTAFAKNKGDFTPLRIPANRYAVFEHLGHVSTLWKTYAKIWDEALPELQLTSLDAPYIERHKQTFDPRTGEGGVDIWIPIKE